MYLKTSKIYFFDPSIFLEEGLLHDLSKDDLSWYEYV